MSNYQRVMIGSWLLAIVLITWSEFHGGQQMPRPWNYTWASVLFLILFFGGTIIPKGEGLFALMAAGFVIAKMYNMASGGAFKDNIFLVKFTGQPGPVIV